MPPVEDDLLAVARGGVGEQIREALLDAPSGSGPEVISLRVRAVAEARRSGDASSLRAAALDLAVSAGEWAAALDAELVQ